MRSSVKLLTPKLALFTLSRTLRTRSLFEPNPNFVLLNSSTESEFKFYHTHQKIKSLLDRKKHFNLNISNWFFFETPRQIILTPSGDEIGC